MKGLLEKGPHIIDAGSKFLNQDTESCLWEYLV